MELSLYDLSGLICSWKLQALDNMFEVGGGQSPRVEWEEFPKWNVISSTCSFFFVKKESDTLTKIARSVLNRAHFFAICDTNRPLDSVTDL